MTFPTRNKYNANKLR